MERFLSVMMTLITTENIALVIALLSLGATWRQNHHSKQRARLSLYHEILGKLTAIQEHFQDRIGYNEKIIELNQSVIGHHFAKQTKELEIVVNEYRRVLKDIKDYESRMWSIYKSKFGWLLNIEKLYQLNTTVESILISASHSTKKGQDSANEICRGIKEIRQGIENIEKTTSTQI